MIEWKFLSMLSHPHIIRCHDVYEEASCFYMVLDYCPMRDLLSMLNAKGGCMSEDEVRVLFKQLMNAIYHCHKRSVVHRDIKLDNILIDVENKVKLADFGFAEEGKTLKDMVGTLKYMAPEVLLEKGHGTRADIWSAGVVLYAMLTGFLPFDGESEKEVVEDMLKKKFVFPIISALESISSSAMDLLRKMLCVNPRKRFTAEEVVKHPWMS